MGHSNWGYMNRPVYSLAVNLDWNVNQDYSITSREASLWQASLLRHPTKPRPATVCLTRVVYACQLVGRRQMHNYIHSTHTGEK